jgi:hypothetical protein
MTHVERKFPLALDVVHNVVHGRQQLHVFISVHNAYLSLPYGRGWNLSYADPQFSRELFTELRAFGERCTFPSASETNLRYFCILDRDPDTIKYSVRRYLTRLSGDGIEELERCHHWRLRGGEDALVLHWELGCRGRKGSCAQWRFASSGKHGWRGQCSEHLMGWRWGG